MLEIQGVSKIFNPETPSEVRSLRGVNLVLEAGSWVIIIGTNGSGKSTLLNAVAGTFLVDEGSIRLAGRDVTRWPEHARAELIGRVFQNPFSGTSPSLTIEENLSLAALRGQGRGLGWGLKQSLVGQMRDEVSRLNMGLENRLENAIGSLSGGQRQALTLLMATWLRPELLLLDEHTAALDPKSADLVIALTELVVARDKLEVEDARAMELCVHAHGGEIAQDRLGQRRLAGAEDIAAAMDVDEQAVAVEGIPFALALKDDIDSATGPGHPINNRIGVNENRDGLFAGFEQGLQLLRLPPIPRNWRRRSRQRRIRHRVGFRWRRISRTL